MGIRKSVLYGEKPPPREIKLLNRYICEYAENYPDRTAVIFPGI
jgi:hypothetical protein